MSYDIELSAKYVKASYLTSELLFGTVAFGILFYFVIGLFKQHYKSFALPMLITSAILSISYIANLLNGIYQLLYLTNVKAIYSKASDMSRKHPRVYEETYAYKAASIAGILVYMFITGAFGYYVYTLHDTSFVKEYEWAIVIVGSFVFIGSQETTGYYAMSYVVEEDKSLPHHGGAEGIGARMDQTARHTSKSVKKVGSEIADISHNATQNANATLHNETHPDHRNRSFVERYSDGSSTLYLGLLPLLILV